METNDKEAERLTKGVRGNVIANITYRADLVEHPISSMIIGALAHHKSLSLPVLRDLISEQVGYPISNTNLRRAINFTNEKLHLIDNLDPAQQVCVAHIYSLTCKVGMEEQYFERVFLVHNQ